MANSWMGAVLLGMLASCSAESAISTAPASETGANGGSSGSGGATDDGGLGEGSSNGGSAGVAGGAGAAGAGGPVGAGSGGTGGTGAASASDGGSPGRTCDDVRSDFVTTLVATESYVCAKATDCKLVPGLCGAGSWPADSSYNNSVNLMAAGVLLAYAGEWNKLGCIPDAACVSQAPLAVTCEASACKLVKLTDPTDGGSEQ